MRSHWLLPILMCWTVAGQTIPPNQPPTWKTIHADDFEGGSADGWAVDVWEGESAGWQVIKDSGNWVFSGTGHSTARLLAGRWPDFRFKARIKLIRGGLFLNYRTQDCDRYFLAFNSGPLVLNRSFPCGTSHVAATVPAAQAIGQWYTVEIVGIGANLKIYIDGVLKLDYTDPNPLLFGGAGLEANPNSQVYVDDVEIGGPPSAAETLVWVKTGGPQGGMGYDVRMRPDNPDVMWATDIYAGANISEDGGRTWRASNKGIVTRVGPTGDGVPVFSLTISPHDNNVIWVGTQNVRGIYKSVDGGKTWVQKDKGIAGTSGITFRGFTVDPRNPNTVYAAGELSSFVWAGQTRICWDGADMTMGVVYKTTDGGENWKLIWKGDNLARYIWIDPRNTDVLYVSTGIFDRAAANSDNDRQDYGGVGILKSTDGGNTWKALGKANGLTTLRIGSLFMQPDNPDVLLAGGGGAHHLADGGVFLSTDRGETWTKTLSSGRENITSVEFAPSDPRVAYAAGEGNVYSSQDGGQSWRHVNGSPYGPPGIRAGVPIDIQVDPRNANRLFINNYGGGNFLSEDGGTSWTVASRGYTGAQIHKVSVDTSDPRRVYAIGRSGVYRSINGGDNWQGLNFSPANYPEWYAVAASPADAKIVLSSNEWGGTLFRSSDAGTSWKVVFQYPPLANYGDTDYRTGQGFKAIAFAPSNSAVVYAGASHSIRSTDEGWRDPAFGIFKSVDGGATWRDTTDSVVAGQNFNVLALDPHNENTVYAGTVSGGVFQSLDGGKSWRAMNRGLLLLDVRALAIDPLNSTVLYAGVNNGGLYKSTDGGATWKPAVAGMDPQASVRGIAIDPTDSRIVYAGDYRSGVYRSVDGGNLWVQINNGLSTRAVKALALSGDGGTLYAATEGEGVFRLDLKPPAESALSCVSAASFASGAPLAPESVVSAFGQGLAPDTQQAPGVPLPTTLANVSLSLTDSSGVDHLAPLFFVSPGQINFEVPPGTAIGQAMVRVLQQNRVVARGQVNIQPVSPALFTANADGKGVPAAVALRVGAGGEQSVLGVCLCGAAPGSCAPVPIDLGTAADQVILELFGTGIRGRSGLAAVTAKIGGQDAEVLYAGPQGGYAGLDQVNIRVPRSLAGRGDVDVVLSVDGKTANVVTVRIL